MKKAWLLVFFLFWLLALLPVNEKKIVANEQEEIRELRETSYGDVLLTWQNSGYQDNIAFKKTISAESFIAAEEAIVEEGVLIQYLNGENDKVEFDVEVEEAGLYTFNLVYSAQTKTFRNIEVALEVNNEILYYEASSIVVPSYYETLEEVAEDRYRNDIMPKASLKEFWSDFTLRDTRRFYPDELLFKLNKGVNKISILRLNGDFYLKEVIVENKQKALTYQEYRRLNEGEIIDEIKTIEAEEPSYKNSLSINYGTSNDLLVTPYHITRQKLNIIDGSNFQKGGDALYYQVETLKTGYYYLTIKLKQSKQFHISYRRLTINGEVPFEEANLIAFDYRNNWQNVTLGNETEKYLLYLNKGLNVIGIEVNLAPVRLIYEAITKAISGINDIALDIKKLSGNYYDKNREWDILASLPNVVEELTSYKKQLKEAQVDYQNIHKTKKTNEIIAALTYSISILDDFIKDPNSLPKYLDKLAVGNNSIAARLGLVLPLITESPLTMDKLYVHGDVKLPKERANFISRFFEGIKRFFLTFFNNQYQPQRSKDSLEIWVNRSRQYVNVMQQMADARFPDSKVNISLMPSEDKLILAASANRQPDVALGVAGWRPYDFAIREAVVDLSEFDDFEEVKNRFEGGAFLQLMYEEGIYGLPETQNFNLLFYRKDILTKLNIVIPDTWEEVVAILPELQRYGMNFYAPLSNVGAFKGFVTTMPFIKQHGGKLYHDDALTTAIDSEEVIKAMTLMTNLYTIYSLPLEVGSFYNAFRYGDIPIGVGDFGMYVQLLFAAPEIAGLWDIAPLPGVKNSEGVVDRSYDGASTSAIIFKNSSKKDEAWEFLKWWTEKDTQLQYSENLIASLGPEYMWNTANVEAFLDYSWNESDKEVILNQWRWINDTEKTPAAYMLERELSNVWNKVVYNGYNVRTAIEDAVVVINKEITRKMIEFGYIDKNGKKLKDYQLPQLK